MVVHEKSKNAVFNIIKAVFPDYESGGNRFPRSDPFGRKSSSRKNIEYRPGNNDCIMEPFVIRNSLPDFLQFKTIHANLI